MQTNEVAKLLIYGQQHDSLKRALHEKRYEESVVATLLKRAFPKLSRSELIADSLSNLRTGLLDFAYFNRLFTDFPMQLSARKIPWAHEAVRSPFVNFGKSPPVKALEDFAFQLSEGESWPKFPVGIVFPLLGHGTMTIHTYVQDISINPVRRGKTKYADGYLLYTAYRYPFALEPFERLLDRIGDFWS